MSRTLFLAGALALVSSVSTAQIDPKDLPEPYNSWLNKEVTYIITPVERDAFLRLESQTEREAFISAFWDKRDENPATEVNETKIEHYERLAYVNEFLGRSTYREGWQTDQGRYFILLGPPRTKQNWESRTDEVYPAELWFYNDAQLKRYNLPPFFYLLFFKRHAVGEYELYNPLTDGPQALLTRVNTTSMDFRNDTELAWMELRQIDPELAAASLSFRTDEGDIAQFQNPSFGTIELVDDIVKAPFVGVDTSYATRLDFERASVESDYMFTFVPSTGIINVLPGPGNAAYLHWAIDIDAQHIAYVRDPDSENFNTVFIASMEVVPKDDEEKVVLQYRRESYVTLNPGDDALLTRPISYMGMAPVVPGDYTVRIILRNRACRGRSDRDCLRGYALLDGDVRVPEWPTDRGVLSDIVVGYDREVESGEPKYRAFRFGNEQVLPNPAGVYAVGDKLVTMIEPKGAPEGAQLRYQLVASELDMPPGTSEEDRVAVDATVPVADEGPIVREMMLDTVQAARYELRATLLDSSGNQLDRRTANLVVTPRTSAVRPGVRGAAPQIPAEVPGVLQMALGEQYVGLEQHDRAKELFQEAVSLNGKLGRAREYLAVYAMESGENQRVVEMLEPVYAQVKDRFEVLELLGRAYFSLGDYLKAIDVFEKAIVLRRPQPPMLNMLANAQYREGNYTRAIELLQRSLAIDANQEGIDTLIESIETERKTASSSNP